MEPCTAVEPAPFIRSVATACIVSVLLTGPAHTADTVRNEDLLWLERVTYGVDATTLQQFRRLGRSRFLRAQLAMGGDPLPPRVAQQVAALRISNADATQLLAEVNAASQQINGLGDESARQAARKTLNDTANQLAYEAARRHLLFALYSPAQLREQLVWFWLNQFSVFQGKGMIRWLLGDYEAQAIRPNALGNFRDLVLATLRHPAMLQYLDNAQNAAGHVNENYARELMELHTLGVDSGYTQQDVQELARILTGVGINATGSEPKLKPEWQKLYVHRGAFEFNPARHDSGTKTLLGRRFEPGGMDEVEAAIDWIIAQPACARFVSRRLAEYFLGTEPSPALLDRMARTFHHDHGNIAALLRTLVESREFSASLGKAFKDPMHFVVSSLRTAYDGNVIENMRPVMNWLNALGEPLYGRQTPDGYPLLESGWTSSGQMSRRFEIARAIASGNAGLFVPEGGGTATIGGFPQIANRLFFEQRQPQLSAATQSALARAESQQEWNTYVLSSPEFNHR